MTKFIRSWRDWKYLGNRNDLYRMINKLKVYQCTDDKMVIYILL